MRSCVCYLLLLDMLFCLALYKMFALLVLNGLMSGL